MQCRCGFSENIRNYIADFSRIFAVNVRKFKFVMYHRIFDIENRLDEAMFLFGGRQVGKSTLLKERFPNAVYIEKIIGTKREVSPKTP